jgi:hypothetical protein
MAITTNPSIVFEMLVAPTAVEVWRRPGATS